MIRISAIEPDVELKDFLTGKIKVGEGASATEVKVYSDWERPTNELPDDFIVIYINGDIEGVGMDTPFARGYIMVSLYCKLNDDGSVKKNRVKKLLGQFDELFIYVPDPDNPENPDNERLQRYKPVITDTCHFEYDADRFITPTTPNQSSGYSVTTLNLRWTTTSNFNS